MSRTFTVTILPSEVSVVQLPASSPIPEWATGGAFFKIARTDDELSIVCETERVAGGDRRSDGWTVLRVDGPFDLNEIGVLASLSICLAEADVSIFVISTWNTDWILVRSDQLDQARGSLERSGHTVRAQQNGDSDV